jgi:hypothetical protein
MNEPCLVRRYRIKTLCGETLRLETNCNGIVTFASVPLLRYWGEWLPVVRDYLEAEHATVTPLWDGEVF